MDCVRTIHYHDQVNILGTKGWVSRDGYPGILGQVSRDGYPGIGAGIAILKWISRGWVY